MNGIRPIWREWLIFYHRWALHDLQRKNATHPDIPEVVMRLRHLLDERAADRPSVLQRAWEWL